MINYASRWGSKLINDGEISLYQFIVSFMGVYFSGQATALAFSFASSESNGGSKFACIELLTVSRLNKGEPS